MIFVWWSELVVQLQQPKPTPSPIFECTTLKTPRLSSEISCLEQDDVRDATGAGRDDFEAKPRLFDPKSTANAFATRFLAFPRRIDTLEAQRMRNQKVAHDHT